MFEQKYRDEFIACSAQVLMDEQSKIKLRNEHERRQHIEDMTVSISPVVEKLQEQNQILQAQVAAAKKDSEEAKREVKKARIQAWVSFGVATVISLAALIVSIFK